jgi:hypothetical protein
MKLVVAKGKIKKAWKAGKARKIHEILGTCGVFIRRSMMSGVKYMAGGSRKLAVVGRDVGKRALVHSAAWTSDSLSAPKPWHAIGSEHAKILKARDTTWHATGGAPARFVVGPAQHRWVSGAAGVQILAVRRYAARTCARFMSTTIT